VEDIMEGFFSAKSLHNGVKMMTFWATDPVLYIDAAAGATWPSRAALTAIWTGPFFSNAPPNALSYPLRIIGNSRSALVEFVERRVAAPQRHGKISRFTVIYDSFQFPAAVYQSRVLLVAEKVGSARGGGVLPPSPRVLSACAPQGAVAHTCASVRFRRRRRRMLPLQRMRLRS
jgi:hypothetical protein